MAQGAGAVLLAAGSGRRLGSGCPKALVPLAGRPLVAWSADVLGSLPEIEEIVLVVPPGADGGDVERAAGLAGRARIAVGGARRRDSVRSGLDAIGSVELVLVHDAARPLLTASLARSVLAATRATGAAVPGIAVSDALVRAAAGVTEGEVARDGLFGVQTPQGFETRLLRAAHAAAPDDWDAPDDGAMVRAIGRPVSLVEGDPANLKVTWPQDLERAEVLLRARDRESSGEGSMDRVGFGWDVHPLAAGRAFRLLGVEVDAGFGPVGHSDGDPLAHAVADALLGAAALGDIGELFPDTDPRFAALPGDELVRRTVAHLAAHGYRPRQVDAVLVLDRPRLAPVRPAVRAALAAALGLPPESVFFKGKRTEGLGSLAGGRGVECHAVATVTRERFRSGAALEGAGPT